MLEKLAVCTFSHYARKTRCRMLSFAYLRSAIGMHPNKLPLKYRRGFVDMQCYSEIQTLEYLGYSFDVFNILKYPELKIRSEPP